MTLKTTLNNFNKGLEIAPFTMRINKMTEIQIYGLIAMVIFLVGISVVFYLAVIHDYNNKEEK